MFKERQQRASAEIPSSSLADIAFLLLIFFLVVTTIDVDTGIGLVLPPPPQENQPPPQINDRNLLNILVNAQGVVLIDEELTPMSQVKRKVKAFILNRGEDPTLSDSPEEAVVSIKTSRETTYEVYIDMLDRVIGAYSEIRNAASLARYGVPFEALPDNSEKQETIEELYPKAISIAEPAETS